MIVISQEVIDSGLSKLPVDEVERARLAVPDSGKWNSWYAWNTCFLGQIYRLRTGVSPDVTSDVACVTLVHERGTSRAPRVIRESVPELTDSEFYALAYMDMDEDNYIE